MLYEYYIQLPSGHREYFKDIKKANEYAQANADSHDKCMVRYDIHGGQSWFYPKKQA